MGTRPRQQQQVIRPPSPNRYNGPVLRGSHARCWAARPISLFDYVPDVVVVWSHATLQTSTKMAPGAKQYHQIAQQQHTRACWLEEWSAFTRSQLSLRSTPQPSFSPSCGDVAAKG